MFRAGSLPYSVCAQHKHSMMINRLCKFNVYFSFRRIGVDHAMWIGILLCTQQKCMRLLSGFVVTEDVCGFIFRRIW